MWKNRQNTQNLPAKYQTVFGQQIKPVLQVLKLINANILLAITRLFLTDRNQIWSSEPTSQKLSYAKSVDKVTLLP